MQQSCVFVGRQAAPAQGAGGRTVSPVIREHSSNVSFEPDGGSHGENGAELDLMR